MLGEVRDPKFTLSRHPPELMDHARAWAGTAGHCPGIGKGPLVQIKSARVQAEEMRVEHPKKAGVDANGNAQDSERTRLRAYHGRNRGGLLYGDRAS
jgi:hypothetical protein